MKIRGNSDAVSPEARGREDRFRPTGGYHLTGGARGRDSCSPPTPGSRSCRSYSTSGGRSRTSRTMTAPPGVTRDCCNSASSATDPYPQVLLRRILRTGTGVEHAACHLAISVPRTCCSRPPIHDSFFFTTRSGAPWRSTASVPPPRDLAYTPMAPMLYAQRHVTNELRTPESCQDTLNG